MSSLTELMQRLSTTRYDIGSTHWVDVTHINQPDNFYIRPTAYRIHLKTLEACDGPLEPSRIKLRTVAIFQSKKKNRSVRGQIYNIREENGKQMCDLFALDYGFMETASEDDLYSPKRNGMPALATLCQLADCYPKGKAYDEKDIEAMVFYVGEERAKMIVKALTPDKMVVQLINTCPEDIATMMALTGYSTIGYGANVASRMPTIVQPKVYFTYKQLKVNDTIKVRVQSGDALSGFFVSDVNDYAKHVASYDDLWMCLKNEQEMRAEDLTVGKPVAVHSGLKYERAIITDAGGPRRKPIAQLVDWGKSIEITGNCHPRPLDREYYFQRPALAIYCSAEDKQAWDNGLQRFLYPGYEFMITIQKVGMNFESPYVVSISKIEK